MQYIHTFLDFFTDNFPSIKLISWFFPIAILFSFLSLFIAGFCKQTLKWRTGFSRKLFHFFIFIAAFGCQQKMGLPAVFILGWSVTLVLIYAIIKGDGNVKKIHHSEQNILCIRIWQLFLVVYFLIYYLDHLPFLAMQLQALAMRLLNQSEPILANILIVFLVLTNRKFLIEVLKVVLLFLLRP